MKESKDLISAIKRLEKEYGHDSADNMLACLILVKHGYFELKDEIDRMISESKN